MKTDKYINYDTIKKAFNLTTQKIDDIENVGNYLQFGTLWVALFFMALFPELCLLSPLQWLAITVGQLVICSIIKFGVKKLFPKLTIRPNGGLNSMPSGHTCASFSGFGIMLFGFTHNWILWVVTILMGVFAVFTAFSRIAAKKHHFRDTIVGSLIGLLTAYFII